VKFHIQPKTITAESSKAASKMISNLILRDAKEANVFMYKGDLFQLENTQSKTADCYVLLKDKSFGKIVKILIINQKVNIILEQSYKVLSQKSQTFQYIMLELQKTSYIYESVHKIYKKLLFINNPLMACAFPNNIECD
jgi:hypothetical protein